MQNRCFLNPQYQNTKPDKEAKNKPVKSPEIAGKRQRSIYECSKLYKSNRSTNYDS